MRKTMLATALFAAFVSSAMAQQATPDVKQTGTPETPPAAQAASPLTGNIAIVSDYRFRGISQTFKQPAIQGGFDYAHPSGFYVGNWNSNVSGNQYLNGGSLEMDFYGGYKFEAAKDLNLDIGLLYYYYPGAKLGNGDKYNNGELYFAGTYKWFSAKYSYGLTDFFGLKKGNSGFYAFNALTPNGNSKGSGYLDLNFNYEVAPKTTLTLHAGHQTVRHYSSLSYTDYKVGVAYDAGFATLGLAVIGTNANKDFWSVSNTSGTSTKELGTTTAVLSVSKTF